MVRNKSKKKQKILSQPVDVERKESQKPIINIPHQQCGSSECVTSGLAIEGLEPIGSYQSSFYNDQARIRGQSSMISLTTEQILRPESAYIDEIEHAERLLILSELQKYHDTRRTFLGNVKWIASTSKSRVGGPSTHFNAMEISNERTSRKSITLLQSKELFHEKAEKLRRKLILLLNSRKTSHDDIINISPIKFEVDMKNYDTSSKDECSTSNRVFNEISSGENEADKTILPDYTEEVFEDNIEDAIAMSEQIIDPELKKPRLLKTEKVVSNKFEILLHAGNKVEKPRIIAHKKKPTDKSNDDVIFTKQSKKKGKKTAGSSDKCGYTD